ncbi:MAG: nucleotidyltransferase family protein [Ramlibacter sp.]|nr:nucleotidyltransferase family protein [Ramlibacter sp.]
MSPATFVQDILRNRSNQRILERWDRLALPDAWLVAGCLFQTVWNLRAGAAPDAQINDYDLFYFDGNDLSAENQQAVQRHADAVLGDIGVQVEAVNQARVHLWYPQVFGHPYPRLASARDGLDRFLVLGTCVGVRPAGSGWEVYAPYGLDLLYDGLLTPNPLVDHGALFARKAASYQARWPWLRIARGATQPGDPAANATA